MDTLGDELQAYRRHRRSTGFLQHVRGRHQELKTAGASPETLLDVARTAGEDGDKLHELGLIFAAYEALIAGSAMDPADRISAAALPAGPGVFGGQSRFIDNFDGFIAPEYRMLEKLVEAEECTVTLCCDGLSDNEAGLGLFSPVKKTAQNLRRIAGKQSVEIAAPHVMQEDFRHKNAPGLAAVNQCRLSARRKRRSTRAFLSRLPQVFTPSARP